MTDNIYYVYQLRVDGDDLPFYVGKGKGNRCQHHMMPYYLQKEKSSYKTRKIQKALSQNKTVCVEFLEQDISNTEALQYELFYISAYGRSADGGCLTNVTKGGDGGLGISPSKTTRKLMSNKQTGELNNLAKLSEEKLMHIYILLHEGVTHKNIAEIMGVGKTTVANIRMGKIWKHLYHHFTNNGSYTPEVKLDGESAARAILKEKDVISIYKELASGMKAYQIANNYGVSAGTIGAIKSGRSWKHLFHNYKSEIQ